MNNPVICPYCWIGIFRFVGVESHIGDNVAIFVIYRAEISFAGTGCMREGEEFVNILRTLYFNNRRFAMCITVMISVICRCFFCWVLMVDRVVHALVVFLVVIMCISF